MMTESTAYALQSTFLPKKGAKMPRIVSGEQQQQQGQQNLPPFPTIPSHPADQDFYTQASNVPPSKPHAALPIPLPSSHIARTKSELQLAEDTEAAEWRDRCMFQRLVVGIRERQAAVEASLRMAEALAPHPQVEPTTKKPTPMLQRRGSSRGSMSKLRMSLSRSSAAVAPMPNQQWPAAPAATTQLPPPKVVAPAAVEVSPYASLTSSPAAPEFPQQPQHAKQHLHDIIDRASDIAADWSLDGYSNSAPLQPQVQPMSARAYQYEQHQDYFLGHLPSVEVEDEAEDDDEIFSLDM